MTDSQAFQDSKEAIIDCVFAFIDRMNDVCDSDNADCIVSEYSQFTNLTLKISTMTTSLTIGIKTKPTIFYDDEERT